MSIDFSEDFEAPLVTTSMTPQDDGEFSLIIPTLSLHSAEEAAALAGLLPKRLCHVKTKADKPAKRTMLSYTKKPQEKVVSHEIIVNGSEYNAILRDFYFDRKPA